MKKGKIIAFLGCDGSGKSSVLDGLKQKMDKTGRGYVSYHWRPFYLGGGKTVSAGVVNDPHSQVPHGRLKSIVKLAYLWADWWLGWTFSLSPYMRKGGVVFFDRWHSDLVADPKRYRYGGSRWLAGVWDRLLPKPDYLIFLDAEPDILLSRKQEVDKETLIKTRAAYHQVIDTRKEGHVVDASAPLDQVIKEVLHLTGLK